MNRGEVFVEYLVFKCHDGWSPFDGLRLGRNGGEGLGSCRGKVCGEIVACKRIHPSHKVRGITSHSRRD